MEIWVKYTYLNAPNDPSVVSTFLDLLPPEYQQEVLKYKFPRDAQLCLFGKLLLKRVLNCLGQPDNAILHIQQTPYKRPYLKGEVDFNISHSHNMVVAVGTTEGRIGIDIEAITEVNIEEFGQVFSPIELRNISQSSNPMHAFFSLWTQKESLIKADGRGMYVPLTEVRAMGNKGWVQRNPWFLYPLLLKEGYITHLAADHKIMKENMRIEKVNF